jgi:hypothetical protein
MIGAPGSGGPHKKKAGRAGQKVGVVMTNIYANGTAAQLPPTTTIAVADFDAAIRNARFALENGPIDCAIIKLEKASRLAGEVGNPHARELANLASALAPALETVELVRMCFRTCSASSEPSLRRRRAAALKQDPPTVSKRHGR